METTSELNFLSTLLPMVGVIFIIAVGVVLLNQQFQKNLYKQQLQQEELKNIHQQELLNSSIQVQENERKRIAQDLHDELGAVLSISRMHLLQLEKQNSEANPFLLKELQNIRSLTENALASMRRISHELMPLQLEAFGLVKTLEAIAAQACKAGTIQIEVKAENKLPELDWPLKLSLYRISMELINNTIKHAEASKIEIEIGASEKYIHYHYTDDGKGLQTDNNHDGLGQKGIEGRIKSMKGTYTIMEKEYHQGFAIRIALPYIAIS